MAIYAADISQATKAAPAKSMKLKLKPLTPPNSSDEAMPPAKKQKRAKKVSEPAPEEVEVTQPKKQRKKKENVAPVEEKVDIGVAVPELKKKPRNKVKEVLVETKQMEAPVAGTVEKKKRKMSEAQLENLRKGREAKAAAIAAAIEKVEVAEEPKPKRVRVKKDKETLTETNPPAWFKKYVEGVKKEEAQLRGEKMPAKVVKAEAQESAQKSWNDGLTRDRISNEVDNHMNRMYGMIFARK